MKQIKAVKNTPNGLVKIIIRFVNKHIFIRKKRNNPYIQKVIEQMKNKGALVQEGKNWIKIDIFKDNELVKIGDNEINLKEMPSEEIEEILSNFYIEQYKKGGFLVETQNGS